MKDWIECEICGRPFDYNLGRHGQRPEPNTHLGTSTSELDVWIECPHCGGRFTIEEWLNDELD